MKNNFYWPPLPGDRETSGAVLGPGHVSPGGPQSGAETANSGKAGLRRPVRPGRRPTAPPQPAEAWASSQAERPPGTSAEASSLSCDAAAAETPQKRRAAEGVRASPPRLAPARASPESPGGEGGEEGGLGGGPERATKASAPPLRRAQTGGGTVFAARGRGGESGVPAAPTAGPGRSAAPQSPRGAQARAGLPPPRGARACPPARSRSQALSPGLHLGSALPAPAPLPPHSPSFPPPAAAAACAHLSCPSGRCRPST